MYLNKKALKKLAALLLGAILISSVSVNPVEAKEKYKNTNRDTLLPEEKIIIKEPYTEDYDKIYESDEAVYYYRDDRDIFAVLDKATGYLWKTGLDAGYAKTLKSKALRAKSEDDFIYFENNPIEDNMNEIYTDFANSLVSIEYRDPEKIENLKRCSSASKDSESELIKLSDKEYYLDVSFPEIDLKFKVYITLGSKGINYKIPFEEMTGNGIYALNSLYLTPFMGSSGGQILAFNRETKAYDIETKKDAPSGYAFVPDGSGALIRFRDNNVSFQKYTGDVYGSDISQGEYYYATLSDAIEVKDTLMPVFGVAYGDNQVAFVGYARSGAEYMSVVCTPEENMTYYTWTCPRFDYNLRYHQVYNKAGDGYFTTLAAPNAFDIDMTYEFLSNENANYVGMAKAYREYLIENGDLTKKGDANEVGLRLDFLMSDAKKSVVGKTNVVMTTAEDVDNILFDVNKKGISNVVSSLWGWQKDGLTFEKPYAQSFTAKIGTKNDFSKLIEKYNALGTDISLGMDYVTINKEMVNYSLNAVKHINSWYAYVDKEYILCVNAPVTDFGFAKPAKSSEWLLSQYNKQKAFATSTTIDGLGNTLTGDYSGKEHVSVTDAINLYQDALENISKDMTINIKAPNMYLWKYTDRFFDAPVGHSQYIFETDAVPFLQLVLNGTMEVYAPYANFSFYEDADILRMIDYNMSPSFIITENPSYYLADTVSADMYSTEYSLYENLISKIYNEIDGVLSLVEGYEWSDRIVLEDGVIENVYTKGNEKKAIIINYTANEISYFGDTISPVSAKVEVIK